MKAIAKNDFEVEIAKKKILPVNEGQLLEFIPDADPEDEGDGEIRLHGHYLCNTPSPFADEHVQLIDESTRIERIEKAVYHKTEDHPFVELPYTDYIWLKERAEKADEYEKRLEAINRFADEQRQK